MAPLILLTNDDGYLSPGLHALYRVLREFGEVLVLAPEKNWSAASRTRVFHKPLRVYSAQLPDGTLVHVTNGSPSDCVLLAVLGVAPRRPDLVVAGINLGANLGSDVTYSGTVSAAIEGAQADIPSLAVSLDVTGEPEENPDYERAADLILRLACELLKPQSLPKGVCLNVNIPRGVPKGIKVTRLGGKIWSEELVRGKDPRGREFFWFSGEMLSTPPPGEEDTDIWAVLSGFVSITPLHLDLTAYEALAPLRALEQSPL